MLKVRENFFREWSTVMAYVLGYIVADGCVISTRSGSSHILNITSADLEHLLKIRKVMGSEHAISRKGNGSNEKCYYSLQIRNQSIAKDLFCLGIKPRKSYDLEYFKVPIEFFADFARGFFDGDGTVYIYFVNGTPQIKAGFVSASEKFLSGFNKDLSRALGISEKRIHKKIDKRGSRVATYYTYYYIDDCAKLQNLFYAHNPDILLQRKKDIFLQWQKTFRRKYLKKDTHFVTFET